MKIIEVVAAIIINSRKQILLARRKKGKHLSGKWEFPGGKVESAESHIQALTRELKEEMNVVSIIKRFVGTNVHDYEKFRVVIHAYETELLTNGFVLSDHDAIEWVDYKDLRTFDLAPADIPFIELINIK